MKFAPAFLSWIYSWITSTISRRDFISSDGWLESRSTFYLTIVKNFPFFLDLFLKGINIIDILNNINLNFYAYNKQIMDVNKKCIRVGMGCAIFYLISLLIY